MMREELLYHFVALSCRHDGYYIVCRFISVLWMPNQIAFISLFQNTGLDLSLGYIFGSFDGRCLY